MDSWEWNSAVYGSLNDYNIYNYNGYVAPSSATNWGTAPIARQWNSSLGAMDYVGAFTTGAVAGLSNIGLAAGVTSPTFLGAEIRMASHVMEMPAIVGTGLAAAIALDHAANGEYYEAGLAASGAIGGFIGGNAGASLGAIAAAGFGFGAGTMGSVALVAIGATSGALVGTLIGATAYETAMYYSYQYEGHSLFDVSSFSQYDYGSYNPYEWGPVPAPSGYGDWSFGLY